MRKRSFVTTLLLLCVVLTNTTTIATANSPKPGAKCSKAGATQTSNGKKFTCVKSGTKLIWNKGVATSKSQPAASKPTPKPTDSGPIKVVNSPIAEANLGCNFANETAFTLKGPVICKSNIWTLVPKDQDSVESRAYRYVLERWNKQPDGNLTVTFYIDPSAGDWTTEIEAGLRAGARFWGTSAPGSRPIPAFISDNHTFIEDAIVKAGLVQSEDSKTRNRLAQSGQAGWHGGYQDPNSYWDFLFRNLRARSDVGYFQVGPHEYTHYAQSQLAKGFAWDRSHMPWISEGIASYFGSALGPMSKMPHNQMDNWRGSLKFVTKPLSFFTKPDQEVYQSPQWGDVYPMGAFGAQALVALFGVEGIINYYLELATGIGNEAAYKKSFKLGGMALTELVEGYVSSVRKNDSWSLQTLEEKYKEAVAKG